MFDALKISNNTLYSGGMFNPMLASVLLGGCKGNTILEHITIYWVGSTVGALGAFFIYPKIKGMAYPSKEADGKKKSIPQDSNKKKQKSS